MAKVLSNPHTKAKIRCFIGQRQGTEKARSQLRARLQHRGSQCTRSDVDGSAPFKEDEMTPNGFPPCIVHHLAERRVLRIDGDDTLSWLNGQVTNDVYRTQTQAVYAMALTAKGKILADMWIAQAPRGLWALVPKPEASLMASFESQIIMEDVELSARARTRGGDRPGDASGGDHRNGRSVRPHFPHGSSRRWL